MLKPLIVFGMVFISLSHSNIQAQCVLNLGKDTSICEGESIQLTAATGFDTYQWNTGNTNASIVVNSSGQYSCSVTKLSANLVNNGDFSLGNTGFSSNYIIGTGGNWGPLSNPGTYEVGTDPLLFHNNFYSFGDHTTGSGNMMICNGSAVANEIVWQQTISIKPNTEYKFSAWMASVENTNAGSEAQLQFSINGSLIGPVTNAALTGGQWKNFFVTWISGNTNTAVIKIVDQNTLMGGNDFALDDIHFMEYCKTSDTIKINVLPKPQASFTQNPSTGLAVLPVQFSNTSINASTNNWVFGDGAFSILPNPIHLYQQTGVYTATLIASNGIDRCNDTAKAVVHVLADPEPKVIIPNIFSPNKDGVNDVFTVLAENMKELEMNIYNRWGNLIHSFNPLKEGWDGQSQAEGTYYYLVKGRSLLNIEFNGKGTIELRR